MTLADVIVSHNRSTSKQVEKPCKYCKDNFMPHRGANPKRNWCYAYKCEVAREQEHNVQIGQAVKRRRQAAAASAAA